MTLRLTIDEKKALFTKKKKKIWNIEGLLFVVIKNLVIKMARYSHRVCIMEGLEQHLELFIFAHLHVIVPGSISICSFRFVVVNIFCFVFQILMFQWSQGPFDSLRSMDHHHQTRPIRYQSIFPLVSSIYPEFCLRMLMKRRDDL